MRALSKLQLCNQQLQKLRGGPSKRLDPQKRITRRHAAVTFELQKYVKIR